MDDQETSGGGQTDEELLAECDVDTFRSSGPGGQHVNTRDSAVRLTHGPSGIVVVAREERSQHRNRQIALDRLRERLDKLNERETPRVPTRARRSVREQGLEEKRRRGEKKRLRGNIKPDDY